MNVRIRPSGNSGWCSRASLLMILGSLVTIPSVFSIETHYQLICDESLFTSDLHLRSAGLTRLAAIPLTCGAVNFLVQHIRQTTFWWERDDESRQSVGYSHPGYRYWHMCFGGDKFAICWVRIPLTVEQFQASMYYILLFCTLSIDIDDTLLNSLAPPGDLLTRHVAI